jgi:hypothetical protein
MRATFAFIVLSLLAVGCNRTPLVSRCVSSADCAGGLVCSGGSCRPCSSNDECGEARCGEIAAGRCGCLDADEDGASCNDCDDSDPMRAPGLNEVCDGRDNDCDGEVDEGVTPTWFADSDGDGFGNSGLSVTRCQAPLSFVRQGGDCNDTDPTSFPGRAEVCDARDNDCNGEIDEGVKTTYFRDADGDGYGDPNNSVFTCQTPSVGFVVLAGDCDDGRPDAHPTAEESCNNRDDDCDGVVDQLTQACSNACGVGQETCSAGLWNDCSAPVITTIRTATVLSGGAAQYSCLNVVTGGSLTVPDGMTLQTSGWLRLEGNAVLVLAPGARVQSEGDLSFIDTSLLLATDATLASAATVRVGPDARWLAQSTHAPPYSTGGSAACASGTSTGVGGAAGGARGGTGGRGGSCGPLLTQPRAGAGGTDALTGANGCDCSCSVATGGFTSGGGGGGLLAGGGGGANAGRGGTGGSGTDGTMNSIAGVGGVAETLDSFGGGGGGSSGGQQVGYAPEACQGSGGAGGGVVRVRASAFTNRGLLSADGAAGQSIFGGFGRAGGGGGGAGGTWVFQVDTFDNQGSISAIGGRGGDGSTAGSQSLRAGGGGGGGGGRVVIQPRTAQGNTRVLSVGNLFVGGGAGGTGLGGSGEAGGPGRTALP